MVSLFNHFILISFSLSSILSQIPRYTHSWSLPSHPAGRVRMLPQCGQRWGMV